MDPPLYSICFPDILNHVASYLEVIDLANVAKVNSHFAQLVRDTGLLYRHVSVAFKKAKSRRKLLTTPVFEDSYHVSKAFHTTQK